MHLAAILILGLTARSDALQLFSDQDLAASQERADALLRRDEIAPLCAVLRRDPRRDYKIKLHIINRLKAESGPKTVRCLIAALKRHNEPPAPRRKASIPENLVKEAIIEDLRLITKKPLEVILWEPPFSPGLPSSPRLPKESTKETARIISEVEDWQRAAAPCVVEDGLVRSIDGIKVNYPDSEKLGWMTVKDPGSIDPKLVALGHANARPPLPAGHALRVTRYAAIGDHILLCGQYDPPIPDGSFNWVVDKSRMRYVGHFLDKDSR